MATGLTHGQDQCENLALSSQPLFPPSPSNTYRDMSILRVTIDLLIRWSRIVVYRLDRLLELRVQKYVLTPFYQ